MKIKNINKFRENIIKKMLSIIYRLDNTGDGIFERNGESNFIKNFISDFKNKEIIIFDIGANVGDYTETVLQNIKKTKNYSLHLFEPQKSCFSDLQNKFSADTNIRINNFGLSDEERSATIYKETDKSGFSSVHKRDLSFYGFEMKIEEKITLKRASDYIKENKIKHISLIKLDVEGHEIKALEGFGDYLDGDFIDYIQFEYGGANLDSRTNLQDFYHLLESRGFKITKLMRNYLELRNYDPRLDNFVYQNYVAVSKKVLNDAV